MSWPGQARVQAEISLIFTSRLDLMQEASRLWSSQTHSRGQKAWPDWRQARRERSSRRLSILAQLSWQLLVITVSLYGSAQYEVSRQTDQPRTPV